MGWTFNTKDPNARTAGPLITGVACALTFISLVTVCLRTYVRAAMVKAFGIDDFIIVVTWICAAGFAIVSIAQTRWGLGLYHINDLPEENIHNFGLLQYMGAPFYITSILGFKITLLVSYLRFIPKGLYRRTTIGVIVACVLFHLSFLLVQINLCQPASKQWDRTITDGSCLPGVPFYTAMASITIVFDVIVMLLPFPMLLKLQMKTRKKIVLLGLFGLGLFITIIQIIRIQTVKRLSNYIDSAPLILWSAVENNLGITVANVPTLAPLVKYYNERSRYGSRGRSGRTGYTVDVESRHTMQTWKSGRTPMSRVSRLSRVLESRSVHEVANAGSFETRAVSRANDSTESIMGNSDRANDSPPPGIVKKVEVLVTRS